MNLKSYYSLDKFEQEEDRRLARILLSIIHVYWAASTFVLLVDLTWWDGNLALPLLLGILFQIAPFILLLQKKILASSFVSIAIYIFIATTAASIGGGIHDYAVMLYPIIVMFAGLTAQQRGLFFATTLALVSLAWLIFGELNRWFIIYKSFIPDWTDLLVASFLIVVAGWAVQILVSNVQYGLAQTRRELAERARVEEALKNSQTRLQALTDSTLQSFVLLNGDAKILSFNHVADRNARVVFGTEMQEGALMLNFIREEERAQFFENFDRALRGETVIVEQVSPSFVWSDHWISLTYNPAHAENGDIVGVCLNTVDITERKLTAQAEREQRTLAEALSNSAAALNTTLNFDEVMGRVLDNVGQVVPHDAANIMLLDKDGDTISIAYTRGYSDNDVKDMAAIRLSLAAMPVLIEAARIGKTLLIPDIRANPAWFKIPGTHWVCSYLTAPIQIRQHTVGFLNLDSATPDFFNADHAKRLHAFASHAAIAIENARLYEEVQKLAVTDTVTGIFNRTFFETELARMQSGRDFPVSIIVADLDNMKKTNDMLGHAAGDDLLRYTVEVLQAAFRADDVIARIGGDEFAVLLPNTDAASAEQMLARVREKLTEYNAASPDLPVHLSLGVATAEPGHLLDRAFINADQRMYLDKARRKSKIN